MTKNPEGRCVLGISYNLLKLPRKLWESCKFVFHHGVVFILFSNILSRRRTGTIRRLPRPRSKHISNPCPNISNPCPNISRLSRISNRFPSTSIPSRNNLPCARDPLSKWSKTSSATSSLHHYHNSHNLRSSSRKPSKHNNLNNL